MRGRFNYVCATAACWPNLLFSPLTCHEMPKSICLLLRHSPPPTMRRHCPKRHECFKDIPAPPHFRWDTIAMLCQRDGCRPALYYDAARAADAAEPASLPRAAISRSSNVRRHESLSGFQDRLPRRCQRYFSADCRAPRYGAAGCQARPSKPREVRGLFAGA